MHSTRNGLAAVIISVFLAALCAGMAFATPVQEESGMEAKEVTLRIFARAYTWDQEAPWEVAKAEIQKRHPETKFTFVEEGFGWADLRAKFLTAAAGGNPPDVAQVDIIWVGEYVEGGLLTDLTDKLNGWKEWPDVVDSFKEGTKWNGRSYGTWLNTDVRIMAYNKKLFRNAGLDPNKPPEDWNQLYTMAKRITSAPAYYGYGFPAMKEEETAMRFFGMLFSAGGQILTNDMKKAAFNSDAGVKALEFHVKMVKDGITPNSIVSGNYMDIDTAVFQDKFAISYMTKTLGLAKSVLPDLTPEKFQENFGAALIPKAPGGEYSTMSGGYLLSVPKGAKHPDLAWELISIGAAPDAQFMYTSARGYVPTFYSLMKRPEDYYSVDPFFNVILNSLPYAHFRPGIPQYTEISAAIQDAIQAAVLGQASPKAALDAAAVKVDQLLAQ
ncbi:MAG: extracellular solute-binding protein [Spirochaetaceae bacterium]|nr:MAG: extracellular solute-binding protein [Spirochaetaceae bacterium]